MSFDKYSILDDRFNHWPLEKHGNTIARMTLTDIDLCKPLIGQLHLNKHLTVFKSMHPRVDRCIVALEIEVIFDSNWNEELIIKHWNYHPARSGIQHTHTTSKIVNGLSFKDIDSFLLNQVKQTFQSLTRLYS